MKKEKDQVLEKELNHYILSKLHNVQAVINSGATIDIDEFIKLIFKFLDSEFDIYPEVQNLSNSLIQQLVNNHIKDISENMVILFIWYTLNRLSSNENVDQIDELFFEIYLNIKDQKVFGSLFDKFQIMFKHRSVKECINYLIKYSDGKSVDMNFIHKLAYTLLFTKQMGIEFIDLYNVLYEYFIQAIENKDDDLIFYLYYPLLLSHNTINLSQKTLEDFNNNIEHKLETYIKATVIPKHNIKINQKRNKKKKIALIIDRLTGSSINKVFNRVLETIIKNDQNYEIYIYNLNWYEGFGSELNQEEIVKSYSKLYCSFATILDV